MPPRIAPAVARAGLPEQLRFHDLRMEALAARRVTAGVPKACPSPVVDLSQTRISAGRNRR